jgi:hypothetical protein
VCAAGPPSSKEVVICKQIITVKVKGLLVFF